MSADDILIEDRDGSVARLTMNRPAARNSLSLEMIGRIHQAIIDLGASRDVHAIVLAGNGPAYCAGHDLKELTSARQHPDKGLAFYRETMGSCSRLMLSIGDCPKPVIAAVRGTATAAGCQLVASCDLAVATSDAQFATPGVNIGLFCSTPMVALSRNVSRKKAMEMLLTGEMIDADNALQAGLINRIVEPEALEQTTLALATRIARKAPATIRVGKNAFYRQASMSVSEAYDYTAEVMVQNMMEPDAEEGIGAFIEKRPPSWRSL
ncbi:enoyl-CoA hydratase [Pelagibius sp. Alg239-R121]|uniref:enoyl-CoA hydratase n=1 Tax=Pelagibius sp. Alg239-R121 TaxID=2993448 RepID=UPI0024A686A4|nr:enoyl-CoA hydratase [Pelagibius sp. Alg239-R121]